MSSKHQLESARRSIKRDKKFARFTDAFESNPNYSIKFNKLHEELERLHATRKTRALHRKSKGFTEDVLDAILQDQSTRSRCAEILGIAAKILKSMTETTKNLRDYLVVEYADQLKAIGTQGERKSFVESVMRPFYKYMSKLELLQEQCKIIIEDIDKANYNFRNLVELIKVLSKPEQVSL